MDALSTAAARGRMEHSTIVTIIWTQMHQLELASVLEEECRMLTFYSM